MNTISVSYTHLMIPVEYSILPIPVNGDSSPPNTNIRNPNRADALPEFLRSISSASVVEPGRINPKNARRKNSVPSTIQTDGLKISAAATGRLMVVKPATPKRRAAVASLNRETARPVSYTHLGSPSGEAYVP